MEKPLFGMWLKQQRKMLKFTQKELANALGYSTVLIRKLESGERRPSRRFLERLALFLGIASGDNDKFIAKALGQPLNRQADSLRDIDDPDPRNLLCLARESELNQLSHFLKASLSGRGQVAFIRGNAGSGKTILAQEFIHQAQQRHPQLIALYGHCNAYEGKGDPYLPFREILGILMGVVEATYQIDNPESRRRLSFIRLNATKGLIAQGPDLINVFIDGHDLANVAEDLFRSNEPELANLKTLISHNTSRQSSNDLTRMDLFAQYTRVLKTISERHPLLLVIDDLQWADAGSISLLFYLGRQLERYPILIIGLYRLDEIAFGRSEERHPFEKVTNEFQSIFGNIYIDLAEAENEQFVQALLSTVPNELSVDFHKALFNHTQGHALFTVEVLQDLKVRGDLIQNEAGKWIEGPSLNWELLPPKVKGVIKERFRRLPENIQEVLQVASIEGETFTMEVIAQVLDQSIDNIVKQLRRLLSEPSPIIHMQSHPIAGQQGLNHFQFRHILFQKHIYNSLNALERRFFHKSVGNALEHLYQNQIGVVVAQLGRHFLEAEQSAKALEYFIQAGERATALAAYEEAIAHFRQASALLDVLPSTPVHVEMEITIQCTLAAIISATSGHSSDEAEEACRRACELCEKIGETPKYTEALLGLHACLFLQGRLHEALDMAKQIMALAQRAEEVSIIPNACYACGAVLITLGNYVEALRYCEEGIEAYTPQQSSIPFPHVFDPGVMSFSYAGMALWTLGYPNQAKKRTDEAVNLARQLDRSYGLALAYGLSAAFHGFYSDAEQVLAYAEASAEISAKKGFFQWEAHSKIMLYWAKIKQGGGEEDFAEMRQALVDWRSTGALFPMPDYLSWVADACHTLGYVDEGLAAIDEAMVIIGQTDQRWREAELLRRKGRLLEQTQADFAQIEVCYLDAIAIAQSQQAKSLELRAVLSLYHLFKRQDRLDEAYQKLQDIYNWFDEGFDTPDLREANRLLADGT